MNVKKPFKSYKGDGKFAYACYVLDDSDFVFPVLLKLHNQRYRIRYDEGVQDEVEVDALRKHNIRHCDVCIVFMSGNALRSQYFLNQIEIAQKFNVNMYVVYVDGAATVESGSKFFDARVKSIRADECSEDTMLDVMCQLLMPCQAPEDTKAHVYTYDELLDEVYPNEENKSREAFETVAQHDSAQIQKSAASAVDAAKAAKAQKRKKNSLAFLNAVVVVGVMIVIAICLYFFFGDQIRAFLYPDEVVNFIPVCADIKSLISLLL